MIKNWVKDRLVKEKRDSELWAGFADAIQSVYEQTVEPILQRISNRKSYFTMDKEDLTLRMSEYGRFFVVAETSDTSRPVLLAQRLDEVHFKGTDKPITSTFWREFDNLPVTWQPLYAPVDQEKAPYGTFFTTKDGVAVAQEKYGEFFLTSRAHISVSLNELYERYGYSEQSEAVNKLLAKFDQIIQPLLPLHIVFDGVALFISFEMAADADRIQLISAGIDYTAKMTYADLQSEINALTMATQQEYAIPAEAVNEGRLQERYDVFPADGWWNDYRSKPDAPPQPIIVASAGTDARVRLFTQDGINRIGIQKETYQGVIATFTDAAVVTMAFPFDGTPEFVTELPVDADGNQLVSQFEYVQYLP
ncbi:phage tail protein [Pantoea agglomerans]|uniref:phage tail protein n=1 Tax=Enterobacter agglomerans TaxID=549 RepID=UPI003C7CBF21